MSKLMCNICKEEIDKTRQSYYEQTIKTKLVKNGEDIVSDSTRFYCSTYCLNEGRK